MSGSRGLLPVAAGRSVARIDLDQVLRQTSADALIEDVLRATRYKEILRERQRIGKFVARGTGIPLPGLAPALMAYRIYSDLDALGELMMLREIAQQMQGQGSARRVWRGRGSSIGWVNTAGWTDLSPDFPREAFHGQVARVFAIGTNAPYVFTPAEEYAETTFPITLGGPGYTFTTTTGEQSELVPSPGWEPVSWVWRYDGFGAAPEIRPVVQGRSFVFSRPGLGDETNPIDKPRRASARLGLPNQVGGERNVEWWRQRRLDLARAFLGLRDSFEPFVRRSSSVPIARTTESREVFPARRAGPPHRWRKPEPGVREKKVKPNKVWVATFLGLHAVTETGDLIEALWKTVPTNMQTARRTDTGNLRFDSMLRDIYDAWDWVRFDEALVNFVFNQLEDLWFGAQGKAAAAAGRNIRQGGGQGGIGTSSALGDGYDAWGEMGNPSDIRPGGDPVKRMLDNANRWAIQSLRRHVRAVQSRPERRRDRPTYQALQRQYRRRIMEDF